MKLKRFLALSVIACMAFAVVATAFAFGNTAIKASAEETVTKIYGYDYSLDYLLKDFGLEKIGENDDYATGRSVKYQLVKDGDADVPVNTPGYSEAIETVATSTVKFLRANCTYKFTVTEDGNDSVYYVNTVTKEDVDEIATVYKADKIADYAAAIDEYAAGLKTSSTFKFSELGKEMALDEIVTNTYFDIDSMKVVIHYCLPGNSSESTTSATSIDSATFNTTKTGDYSFYFIFTDSFNNSDSTADLVIGNGGYYTDHDGDGKINDDPAEGEVDTLVIPVFTFTVTENSKPEVSVTVSEKAYLNLKYKIDAFNITATDYSTKYELYFIPKDAAGAYVNKDDAAYDVANKGDDDYIKAVKNNAACKDVTDILDVDELSFTPTEAGYYYAFLKIYNNSGYYDEIMTYAISCTEGYEEVKLEKQFFKYNVTSIVFLSISAVSFIGIIVVLLIRPKNTKALEVKTRSDDGSENK